MMRRTTRSEHVMHGAGSSWDGRTVNTLRVPPRSAQQESAVQLRHGDVGGISWQPAAGRPPACQQHIGGACSFLMKSATCPLSC